MSHTGADDAVGPAHRPWWPLSVAFAVAWVALDQLTKHWAVNGLSDGRTVELVWTLRFKLVFNSGMAFGQAEGIGPVLGAVALVVVVVLLMLLRRQESPIAAVAVGLIVGGASGNLIDRLCRDQGWLRGRVVDFIDLQWWPVFNVADIGITVGGALLIVGAARRKVVEARRA